MTVKHFGSAPSRALSNMFPSTHYEHAFYLANKSAAIQAGNEPRGIACNFGYILIGDLLVPLSFVETVKEALCGFVFQNDFVLSAGDMFEKSFLNALDAYEWQVLMPVALILIEQGNVETNLCPAEEEAA